MATQLYPIARKAFADGDIDLTNNDIRVILIDTADYSYSDTHDFLDDVAGAARVAVSSALTGKTTTNGVFDHGVATWTSVTGDTCEAVIYYQHTGTEGTSRLIAYVDNAIGLPVTPNGEDITYTPSTGSNKAFKL